MAGPKGTQWNVVTGFDDEAARTLLPYRRAIFVKSQAHTGGPPKCILALSAIMMIPLVHAGIDDVIMQTIPVSSQLQASVMDSYSEEETGIMHMSPVSDLEEDILDEGEPVTYKVSNRVLLTLLRMPVFCALTYQEDVVRLAQTSRVALGPYVDFHLAFIRHIVTEYSTWCEDWCAERHAEFQLQEFYAEEFPDLAGNSDADRCWTCGVRPGCDWLGNYECYVCFSEHQLC